MWKTVRVDPRGRLACLAVHSTAPLIAAGSTTVGPWAWAHAALRAHEDGVERQLPCPGMRLHSEVLQAPGCQQQAA